MQPMNFSDRFPLKALVLATTAGLGLAACGGDGSGGEGSPASSGNNATTVSAQTRIAPGSQCPAGGIEVESGIDENGNGKLDSAEVDTTEVVCNGEDGNDGMNGLVNATDIASGHPECAAGGIMIETGLDANGNGTLDSAEVNATNYLCAEGSAGGENATAGDTSESAISTNSALTRMATLPLGAEATGMFLTAEGDFFFNVQHPSAGNFAMDYAGNRFRRGTVGVITDFDFDENREVAELSLPQSQESKEIVRTSVGKYQVLGQEGDAVLDTNTAAPTLGTMTGPGGTEVKTSNDPDFNGFIRTGNGEGYLFTNWEDRPGGMSRMHLAKQSDGSWYVQNSRMIDFSNVEGTWVNCFGTVSPWHTPLTSEELYFNDTRLWNEGSDSGVQNLAQSLGYPRDGSGQWPNPYRYGFIVEILDPTTDNPTPEKREALGRFSHENAVVMPDEKTVYMSDDGTGTVFYKFVADTAGDLSSGTLYAADVTQVNTATGNPTSGTVNPTKASFDINWIELGSGSESEIEAWIAEYDGVTVSDYQSGQSSYISDQKVNDWAEAKTGTDIDNSGSVASDPFNDDRPAFLESRKAAAKLGATAEFRKMEGVNINLYRAKNQIQSGNPAYAYMAMSNFNATMGDAQGDIQLDDTHGDCGAVYQMELMQTENSQYDITRMDPAVVGGPYNGSASVNTCSTSSIAEPDNLVVLGDGKVLIGEDTGEHENNMLWAFDPDQTRLPYADPRVTAVFYEDFEQGLGKMTSISVSSSENWEHSGGYAAINGYQTSNPNDDYLVSEPIDLSGLSSAALEFTIWFQYIGEPSNELSVLAVSDSDYTGDPATTSWDTLSGYSLPSSEEQDTQVGPIDLSAYTGGSVRIAFRYQSPADDSSITSMKLQDVSVLP